MEKKIDFDNLGYEDISFYLIGLISSFDNSLQATADMVFQEMSWKQSLFINSMVLFDSPPTIREVARKVGCSHQNATKILKRLEELGFLCFVRDKEDKRKQRIVLTQKAISFKDKYNLVSLTIIKKLFSDVDSEELKTTIKVITKLSENISDIGGDTNDEEE